MKQAATAALLLLMSFLSWKVCPGHTWLQQDTQIYVPILENLRDRSVLSKDILVERPHVAFTVYDELTLSLRKAVPLDLEAALGAEQIVFRALGLWGVYLIALSLGLKSAPAFALTLLWSLGATVNGPAVLTVEYEPIPRGFAVPLLMLAIGLGAQGRWLWSGVASGAAVLLHPPTVWPVLAVYLWWRPARIALLPISASTLLLLIFVKLQAGITETQSFFTRLDPQLEKLQRMRASYNWLDLWWRDYLPQYFFLTLVVALAAWRLWPRMSQGLRWFTVLLPFLGLLTLPVCYVLLNVWHWALIPQLQPMRALLFTTALAGILTASCGCIAAYDRRYAQSFLWFLLPCLLPIQTKLFAMPLLNQWLVWLGAAALCVVACSPWQRTWILAALYWPFAAVVSLYPHLRSPELSALSEWAHHSTSPDAVFLFADNGKANYPGVFRAEAQRAVFVDWKGGGQVNYLPDFAREWWRRWQAVQLNRFDAESIDYLVVSPLHSIADKREVFHNSRFRVYKSK